MLRDERRVPKHRVSASCARSAILAENELKLSDNDYCFGCGKANPIGLKLDFTETEDGEYVTEFTPRPEHQGWRDITHGGILTTVADEAIGRMMWAKGVTAVTAEMTIQFKRPARSGAPLKVIASVVGEEGRVVDCKAEIRRLDGTLVAEATGKMVKI